MPDIGEWLTSIRLERYRQTFLENGIDLDVVDDLTDADLRELGLSLGDRKRFLRAAAAVVRRSSSLAATPQPHVSPTPSEAERRHLTVMFCDLVGSTALSARLDPEDLRQSIVAYHTCATEVVGRYDGFVAKYMGDGILVYFGYPQAHEEDAERAVRAGLAVVEAVAQLDAAGERLAVRIGIATGLVVAGDIIGAGEAEEHSVVGETPNLAARLQALAEPGTLVIAEATRALLRGQFKLESLGVRSIKGFAEAAEAFRVLGEVRSGDRFEACHATEVLPMVGRDQELALLVDRWTLAKAREGQVVLLEGEAGIGKSRLALALRDHLSREPHLLRRYCTSPYHTNSALRPVIAQLEQAAGFERDDSSAVKLARLQALLAEQGEVSEAIPLLAELLGIPSTGRYQILNLAPQQRKSRTSEVLIDQLARMAGKQPVLMVLEDAHWLDPSSLELFGLFVDRIQQLSVLLVITYRPEFVPPWRRYPHVTRVALNRLDQMQAQLLVERLTGGMPLPIEMLDYILANTDGVPLFLEELTKTMLESGLLGEAGDHFGLAAPMTPLAVPVTLHDSLMARLDRLGRAKVVAQIGACIGREFSYELIAAVAALNEPELLRGLDELVGTELVFRRGSPPKAIYSFKHALVRDTAYQSLLKSRRRELHRRIAQVFEEQAPHVVAAQPELLAHHLTGAGQLPQAIVFWHRAGEHANDRAANAEAAGHLAKGLDLLTQMPENPERLEHELTLLTTLGQVLTAGKGYGHPEVERVYSRALSLAERVQETPRLFPVLLGLTIHHAVRSELSAARDLGKRLLALAQQTSDPVLVVEASYALGITCSWLGEFASAWQHFEHGISQYDVAQHRAHLALYGQDGGPICLCRGGMALWYLGHEDRALELMAKALAMTAKLGHTFSRAYVLTWAAILHVHRRDVAKAQEAAELASAFAAEHEFPFWHTQGVFLQGWVLAERDQVTAGIERLRKGLAGMRAIGSGMTEPWAMGLLAAAYGKADRFVDGHTLIDEALAIVSRTRNRWCEAELHRLKGELISSLSERNPAEIEACFHRAVDVARMQDAKMWELRSAVSLARLWRAQGLRAQVCELLAPLLGCFAKGHGTLDLQDAQAVFESCGGKLST
ncbi:MULTISPECIES: adenylate/guanylate cyclase domain-containing protein [unclassified Ensifer]|uniref:adenylate/guanylate cyclase domain-containing protein n=1 Tax=unclassified Ensifer TaxID=2633371 RepID=UPI0008134B58|nr:MULTISPECIES: adenylate/guanylate cyclase domain-containing protein [unclassified Ensifer]OCP19692.1 adenylate cyclase [Ensifer sp. LC54]OCP19723.1 adenylate cyclase [Ensifer sp. LC384]